MATYQLGMKIGNLFGGTLCMLVGLGFIAAGAHGAWGNSLRGAAVEIGAIGIGSVAAYLGWGQLWLCAYEIRLSDDGTIEFTCVLRRVRVRASDVTSLHRAVAFITIEGVDARELRVRSTSASVRVGYFDGIDALMDVIQRIHPSVKITGYWPPVT